MKFVAKVYVTPKPAILDPQGKAIANSLHSMGHSEVLDVRLGKYVELKLEGDSEAAMRDAVEAMCKSLLANEVIEDFRFDLSGYEEGSQQ